MSCCGGLRRIFRRGKSLPPPGGTKAGDKKLAKAQKQTDAKSLSTSLPNLPKPTEQPEQLEIIDIDINKTINKSIIKSESDLQISHDNNDNVQYEEDDYDQSIIEEVGIDSRVDFEGIPAPSSFRSKSSEEEFDEESIIQDKQSQLDLNKSSIIKKPTDPQNLNVTGSSMSVTKHSQRSNMKSPMVSLSKKSPKLKHTSLKFEKSLENTIASQTNKSIDNDISEISHISHRNEVIITSTIQKLFETYSVDRVKFEKLKTENENLRVTLETVQKESLERETKTKEENDFTLERIQSLLIKESRSDAEKDALKSYFLSKQQSSSENLIKQQKKLIATLEAKCAYLEIELKKASNRENEISQINFDELKEEINGLKYIVYHLNLELSSYQAKYPPPSVQVDEKSELVGLQKQNQIPIWLVNSKYLSPLIAAYDERILEKDEKLKLLKKNIESLTNKFHMILNENADLKARRENTGALDSEELKELKKIRHYAKLVLDENKILKEEAELVQAKLFDLQKNQIKEVGTLSKKIIVSETDKTDLKNQIEVLRANYDELLRKYNETLSESQRRVPLQEHLNQTGELKRKLDELNYFHKKELEGVTTLLKNIQEEKNELNIKYSSLNSENKKLLAENKVLDKALNEGIGRKTQRKLQELQKRLELVEIEKQTAENILGKLKQENEKIELEKEAYQNLVKSNEIELKRFENKIAEEDLKAAKLEDKLNGYKDKSASKVAELLKKLNNKDSEFSLFKLETDKKMSDFLNLLHKKQEEVEELVKEKRQMEAELEYVWKTTTSQNRKLKESLLDFRLDNSKNSSVFRLRVEDL